MSKSTAASLFKPETSKSSTAEVLVVQVPGDSPLSLAIFNYVTAQREFKAAEAAFESMTSEKALLRKEALKHYLASNQKGKLAKSVRLLFVDGETTSSVRVSFTNSYKSSLNEGVVNGFKAISKAFSGLLKTTEKISISQEDVPKDKWSQFVEALDAVQKKFGLDVIKFSTSTLPVAEFAEKRFELNLADEDILKAEVLLPTPTTVAVE